MGRSCRLAIVLVISLAAFVADAAPAQQPREARQKAGVDHVWVESDGAHVWTEWREYLADFAPRLFR
jgi:hypothetical protein